MILVSISLVIGAWYFLLRGSSTPSPTFIKATDRFTASIQASLDAEQHVQRRNELTAFDAKLRAASTEMRRDIAIFQRLAHTESGQAAAIAKATATTGSHALNVLGLFDATVVDAKNLNDAEAARAQLTGFMTALNAQAAQWKKLG